MSGVTNRLIEAARRASQGDTAAGGALVESLRQQHRAALAVLVLGETARAAIDRELEEVLAEGKRLYDGTAMLRELTPRTLDIISSLGERLCAPNVCRCAKPAWNKKPFHRGDRADRH